MGVGRWDNKKKSHTSLLQLPRPWWLAPPGGRNRKRPSCQLTLRFSCAGLFLKVTRNKQAERGVTGPAGGVGMG